MTYAEVCVDLSVCHSIVTSPLGYFVRPRATLRIELWRLPTYSNILVNRDFLRLTIGKFETELARRAPHNRENGLKITTGVHFFLVFTKIALNKPLLPYGLWRREIMEAPCTFSVALGRLEDISNRVWKLTSLHIASMRNSPLPTYGRNFVKGKFLLLFYHMVILT